VRITTTELDGFADTASNMACSECEITADVDGRTVHVQTRFQNLDKLAWSDETNCQLHRCRACESLWESCAYEKASLEISLEEARRFYPAANLKIDREARVKERLRTALDHVQSFISSGGDADHPVVQLEVADRELRKMLAALEDGALSRHQPSGLWRMITDSWPIPDALGEEIVAAELEFDRLLLDGPLTF